MVEQLLKSEFTDKFPIRCRKREALSFFFAQGFFSQPKILVFNCRENFHIKTFLEQNKQIILK